MKLLISLALLSVFCLTGCATDGYVYKSSGGYYQRPSYYSQPYQQPEHCEERAFVGPQYYKTFVDSQGPVNFKNYMDAPVVVERPYGGSIVIPRSWN
jgi:hypothetical protein